MIRIEKLKHIVATGMIDEDAVEENSVKRCRVDNRGLVTDALKEMRDPDVLKVMIAYAKRARAPD